MRVRSASRCDRCSGVALVHTRENLALFTCGFAGLSRTTPSIGTSSSGDSLEGAGKLSYLEYSKSSQRATCVLALGLLARSFGRLVCMKKRIMTCTGMRSVEAQCCGISKFQALFGAHLDNSSAVARARSASTRGIPRCRRFTPLRFRLFRCQKMLENLMPHLIFQLVTCLSNTSAQLRNA